MSAKWTAGEVRRIIEDREGDVALEILSEVLGKGPHVIDYDDWGDPEAECNCLTGRPEDPQCPVHGGLSLKPRKAAAS